MSEVPESLRYAESHEWARQEDDGTITIGITDHAQELLGDLVFALDEETMESTVLDALRERGLTLGVAETITGGLLGSRLSSVVNGGDVFRGAVVALGPESRGLLDVTAGPEVSSATTQALAEGVRRRLGCDVGLATTGVAGPGEADGEPAGTAFLAVAFPDRNEVRRVQLPGNREQIRSFSIISVLNLLRLLLEGKEPRVL